MGNQLPRDQHHFLSEGSLKPHKPKYRIGLTHWLGNLKKPGTKVAKNWKGVELRVSLRLQEEIEDRKCA